MSDPDALTRGQAVLRQLQAGSSATSQRSPAEEAFPDFWRMTQQHLFGEVWARPGLALRDRSMITVTSLMVLGRTEELKVHIDYALNIGLSREEILEVIMHVAHYAGWPAGMNAVRAAREVFSSRQ